MWYLMAFFIGCCVGVAVMCMLAYVKADNENMESEWQRLKDRLSEGKEEGK